MSFSSGNALQVLIVLVAEQAKDFLQLRLILLFEHLSVLASFLAAFVVLTILGDLVTEEETEDFDTLLK